MRKSRFDRNGRMPRFFGGVPLLFNASLLFIKKLQAPGVLLWLLCFLMQTNPAHLFGQCNPAGNPSRYEYNIEPGSMLNIIGQEFCTSQSMGTNCCGAQPSYRCLDLVFNLENGPMGEMFGTSCQGMINLMTANGNFDALFFDIGTPDPMGNATDCAAPINIGNNHIISVEFAGNAMGQIEVSLAVIDNMGMTIHSAMATAMPGQAVMLTICKPGFGCLEDEIIFGCCAADATLALAPAAPETICSGGSTSLKVTGMNGTAPYTVMLKAAGASDTTYFAVPIPDDMDGNSLMDMITTLVSPTETTVYSIISVEDAAGCVQPVSGQSVEITVNPIPDVDPVSDQTVCAGAATTPVVFTSTVPGTEFNWTNTNTAIGLAASGMGDIPSFAAQNAGTTVQVAMVEVTPAFTGDGVTCTGMSTSFSITVNPAPTVDPVSNQELCSGETTTAISFSGAVAGTVFNWTNSNTSIGLAASGTGDIAAFVAQNAGAAIEVATIEVTPVFTNDGVDCPGVPISFTITVYPRPTVFAGSDQDICQNGAAGLVAVLGGGATGGAWSGGAGVFANPFSPTTTYTPAPAEYGTTFELIFTTTDPAGPCPAASDALLLTVNTLPLVYAGKDVMICLNENLDISELEATFDPNGSGATTASWTSSGTGVFQPNNSFSTATSYVPSAADRLAGFVTLTLTSGDPPGPCAPAFDQAVLFFYDPDGIVCNDNVMIALDEDGIVCIEPDMILEGDVVDSMYVVEVLVNGVNIGNKVDCSHVGQTLLVRVRSICTGVFCTGSIVVMDNLPPNLTCTNIELICAVTNTDPDYLQNVLGISNAYPLVEENCGQYTLTRSDTWHDLTCDDDYIGYVRRVWTAVDASGNKATCTQYINFLHQNIGDVQFPESVTLYCDEGVLDTTPQGTGAPYLTAYGQIFPLYPDAGYCRLAVAYVNNVLPICDGSFDIIRTWTVYDWCSPTTPTPPSTNPKYYVQVIKVRDETGPELTCPDDLTVSTDPLNCCATTDLPDVIVRDNCSRIKSATARVEVRDQFTGDEITTYDIPGTLTTFPGNLPDDPDTLAAFGFTPCLPLGTHTVTYFLEDGCGNTASCSYNLTVEDGTPPVPACDEITQVALGIDGMIFVNATTFDDGSYDNCAGTVYFKARRLEANTCQPDTLFYDQVKFCCEDINDTILVILRVYDVFVPPGPVALDFEEENSNECQVQVFVEDKMKPSCSAPANVTVSCENFDPSLWAYGSATGVDNCCIDTILTSANYQLFDTLCNKGTITRTFRVVDCGGQSTSCTQRVIVNYEQDYYIQFPHDWIATACNGSGNWGEPAFFGEDCELLGVSYEDVVFTVVPDACFKIERTWTIINWCTYDPNLPCIDVPNPNPNTSANHPSNLVGPTVSPPGTPFPWAPTVVKVKPDDQVATDFSSFWSANANCYKYKQIIKVIDGQKPEIECPDSTVQVCDLTQNDAQLWNQPYWFDPMTGSHNLCEAPTDLCITASDACSDTNVTVRYLLFLDLDNNGTMETVVSSTNPPAPGTVQFDNAGSLNYAGGSTRFFDGRPVLPAEKYRFALQTAVSGGKVVACLRWNTQLNPDQYVLPELPYGTHKIKWFVLDGCGNEQVCEYTFVVKDCKPPTVTCLNGLSINIMPTGMVSINALDFVQDAYDNCTPSDLLIHGILSSGNGVSFPFNPDGTPQTTLQFTCDDVSFFLVEIWAMDLAGNSDFCQTYIKIQDNFGICGAANASVAGSIHTESGDGVEDVQVQVQGLAPAGQAPFNLIALSDQSGQFSVPNQVPLSSNAMITPLKDNDPLNGVSTFDLVLINKHILGLEPLNSPYKMIAADANNSRSITTFDILEFRKLILGVYTELPENTSWRFIDKSYVFPNPYNPFQDVFPETKSIQDLQGDQLNENFMAVKTGDVNGNAVASSFQAVEARSAGQLLIDVTPTGSRQKIIPNEVFTVHFAPSEAVAGYQFTLYFPNLELLAIEPGEDMSLGNFGTFDDAHALTVSFNTNSSNDDQPPGDFALTFRAKTGGKAEEMLRLSSQITRAEAYRASENTPEQLLDIGLRFDQKGVTTISGVGFELYQNRPNPWTNSTRIGFHLPESAEAVLTVLDNLGKIRYTQKGYFEHGYNSMTIDNSALGSSGVLYYKLETPGHHAVKSMIYLR